ncbi:MAG: response regulator transcription factor [Chloroflexi bacterium]|nr:response regulator transcription factor [Chloroflexota bacterium]
MTERPTVRVLLADDHPIVRAGLRAFLLVQPGMVLAGEAASGPAAVEEALRTRPDVVLMDLNLPGMDGMAAARQIRAALPATQVILLTGRLDGPISAAEAAQAGLAGCLMKSVSTAELARAIHVAARGDAVGGATGAEPTPEEPPVSLTPLRSKLGLADRTQAAVYAAKHGLAE